MINKFLSSIRVNDRVNLYRCQQQLVSYCKPGSFLGYYRFCHLRISWGIGKQCQTLSYPYAQVDVYPASFCTPFVMYSGYFFLLKTNLLTFS